MGKVTGQPLKSEVLILAEKIVELCQEHTSSEIVALTATEIAGKVMTLKQVSEEPVLSVAVRERSA
jgi:hypothetical protein